MLGTGLLLMISLKAQYITQMEYYIDTDPGFGAGTPVTFSPGFPDNSLAEASFSIPTAGLKPGIHQVNVRVKDSASVWSEVTSAIFTTVDLTGIKNISQMEYFVDMDPGFGMGTQLPITPGNLVQKTFSINISGLTIGFHQVVVRVKNTDGKWSILKMDLFYAYPPVYGNISKLEYYIDSDPGFDNGIQVPVTAGPEITKIFSINTTGITPGIHQVNIRAKDTQGRWSILSGSLFLNIETSVPGIVQMEYFIDNDPGFGLANQVPVTPGNNISEIFTVDTTGMGPGVHYILARVKDSRGRWSITNYSAFVFLDIKAFIEALYDPNTGEMIKTWDDMGEHFPGDIVDTISIKLADHNYPYTILFNFHGASLLKNGLCKVHLGTVTPGTYYIIADYKNAITTWSSNPVSIGSASNAYDFTDAQSEAFGDNLKLMSDGMYAMYSGDINIAGILYPDPALKDGMIDQEDMYYIFDSYNNGDYGYFTQDLNGDGMVDSNDMYLAYDNFLLGAFMITP